MPLDRAALIGCGVTTGVGAVLNTAQVEPGSTVAVFGAGGVGLAAIQGARIAGARMIIAVDVVESQAGDGRRSSARPTPSTRRRTIRSRRSATLTNGGVDYSFEAIGLKKAAEQCFECLRAGRHRDDHRHDPGRPEDRARRQRVPAREEDPGQQHGLEPLQGRHAPVHRLLPAGPPEARRDDHARAAKLEDVNEAFRAMKAGEVARTVLMFDYAHRAGPQAPPRSAAPRSAGRFGWAVASAVF